MVGVADGWVIGRGLLGEGYWERVRSGLAD
jgi:hypothetical protein